MTIYVLRDGVLRPKGLDRDVARDAKRSDFPAPRLSRIEPFESPVTGKEITSWRDRDRDMAAAGAVDPRDLPQDFKRGRAAQKREAKNGRPDTDFGWGSSPS